MSELKKSIQEVLSSFASGNLRDNAKALLNVLGYRSEKIFSLLPNTYEGFSEMFDINPTNFNTDKAKSAEWKSIDIVFQLDDDDIANGNGGQFNLLPPRSADLRRIESYLIVAIELQQSNNGQPVRSKLCDIAREINRVFRMPVLLIFKYDQRISLAITYRRVNKKDGMRDVVGRKVTLIKDIDCQVPHPGHLAILEDFSLSSLSAFRGRDIHTFADLDEAWRESLSVEILNRQFYKEIANWYFWARDIAIFPKDAPVDADGKPSLSLIRLLTRLIFCWFLREKTNGNSGEGLIPADVFDPPRIRELLNDAGPDTCTYYPAILQNLFFATLNTEMDSIGSKPIRRFIDVGDGKSSDDHMVHQVWRHKELLRDVDAFERIMRRVPFLNGGLFECLDDRVQKGDSPYTVEIRIDGFSSDQKKQPKLPNYLFFGEDKTVDLSGAYGDNSRSREKVKPLLEILSRYKFTLTENTPVEEEVALDPELLGHVFENLLAAYNPETGTIARKATGSFYTPRVVVDWMVDQALIVYLSTLLMKGRTDDEEESIRGRLASLVSWNETTHDFSPVEVASLIDGINRMKALDPACGSGAFPMGLLQKLVLILRKLDPENKRWKNRQFETAQSIESSPAREEALKSIERAFARDNDDYGRKLYLIENCLFGVDIQPIAVQIAKLRFFISLVVEQSIEPTAPNYGILPLPNLETKIVAANTLLGLHRGQLLLGGDDVRRLEKDLQQIRHDYFTARRYQRKKELRKQDRDLCQKLSKALVESGECTPYDAQRLVDWNPYNTNISASFFDPGWMFGLVALDDRNHPAAAFDIVIGNPPYVRQEELKRIVVQDSAGRERPIKDIFRELYECYTGTADLYVYFIERSLQLLRTYGVLSFITSNKYFRAAYGENLRTYLLYSTRPIALLDFGDSPVFTAIAYPCILVTQKNKHIEKNGLISPKKLMDDADMSKYIDAPDRSSQVLTWIPGTSIRSFPDVFEDKAFRLAQRNLKPDSWRLESSTRLRLLDRLRRAGQPLGEYVRNRIYYGIKTGLNEAFVVNRSDRDRLIAEHPSSAEVIKPFLRGRDVKRWRCEFAECYLIKIESSENRQHAWSDKSGKAAENSFAKELPAIHSFFTEEERRAKLMKRYDQGRFFWELRSCDYWNEFIQPKIICGRFMDKPTFAYDEEGYYHNDALYLIAGITPYVAAILNSNVNWYFLCQLSTDLQNGYLQALRQYQIQSPIPDISGWKKDITERMSKALIWLNKADTLSKIGTSSGLMIAFFEQWLNGLIYELFLPEELHERKLRFFDYSKTMGLPNDEDLNYAGRLEECFQHAYNLSQPLRAMLADLRTIEEVRIIEESGKHMEAGA